MGNLTFAHQTKHTQLLSYIIIYGCGRFELLYLSSALTSVTSLMKLMVSLEMQFRLWNYQKQFRDRLELSPVMNATGPHWWSRSYHSFMSWRGRATSHYPNNTDWDLWRQITSWSHVSCVFLCVSLGIAVQLSHVCDALVTTVAKPHGHFYWHGLILIQAWISNHTQSVGWKKTAYTTPLKFVRPRLSEGN